MISTLLSERSCGPLYKIKCRLNGEATRLGIEIDTLTVEIAEYKRNGTGEGVGQEREENTERADTSRPSRPSGPSGPSEREVLGLDLSDGLDIVDENVEKLV